jgi:hypothetical protein
MPLYKLMNYMAFHEVNGRTLDANFISRYDAQADKFEYFVQRLFSVSMEDEKNPKRGKNWVVYINSRKAIWGEACERDLPVKAKDEIVWRYQTLEEDFGANTAQGQVAGA